MLAFWNGVSSFDNVFPNPIINFCCIFISSKPIWFGNLLQLFIFTDIKCCYNLSVDIRICWHFMILMSFCWLDGDCLLRSSCCHSCHLFDWSCVLCFCVPPVLFTPSVCPLSVCGLCPLWYGSPCRTDMQKGLSALWKSLPSFCRNYWYLITNNW